MSAEFESLVAEARDHDDVLGLFVFGSRRSGMVADERSDWDDGVVVRDDAALARFDARHPYAHVALVEVASATFDQLREHAAIGSDREWARYLYAHVDVLIDKTGGELTRVLADKERIPPEKLRAFTADALGAYVNSTYRSLRAGMVGLARAARLDAAESVPSLLRVIFAFEGRIRPFNKYLAWELEHHPLTEAAWTSDALEPQLDALLDGDADAQRALFRDVERVARAGGFDPELDEWEPDVAWLRGDGGYRPG